MEEDWNTYHHQTHTKQDENIKQLTKCMKMTTIFVSERHLQVCTNSWKDTQIACAVTKESNENQIHGEVNPTEQTMEDDKYTITLKTETYEPYISSLEATYILTMSTSSRITLMDERLMQIARKTYVQINRGFVDVPTSGICNTSMDLVHAVRNVCEHAMDNHPGYILVLEDDAMLLTTAAFAAIDEKLRSGVNLYSLGSIGVFVPCGCTHARVVGNFIGFAQGIIYSAHVQQKLLNGPINYIKHIDAHFLSRVPEKYACVRPVVVQLLPHTSNMDEWSISTRKTGKCERVGVRMFICLVQRILRLDKYHHGWYVFYACNYMCMFIVAIAIFAVIVGFFFWVLKE